LCISIVPEYKTDPQFFTKEELRNTISIRNGVNEVLELSYRQRSANLIEAMGWKLQIYPFQRKKCDANGH
jgi:hypothetical protein